MKEVFSTAEVAAAIGVDKSTLLRWLYAKKIPEPKIQVFGGISSRVWTEKDLQIARRYREERYRRRS